MMRKWDAVRREWHESPGGIKHRIFLTEGGVRWHEALPLLTEFGLPWGVMDRFRDDLRRAWIMTGLLHHDCVQLPLVVMLRDLVDHDLGTAFNLWLGATLLGGEAVGTATDPGADGPPADPARLDAERPGDATTDRLDELTRRVERLERAAQDSMKDKEATDARDQDA